ncbi:hypothetical protein D1AOALGA4SA_7774 [Olavius algarvensis Delta 1 endosymbiont]|nr:hypothetical protein D1AOALGA4SA_7774 [Olavius algarvensis Delta 1 endosymbiont]
MYEKLLLNIKKRQSVNRWSNLIRSQYLIAHDFFDFFRQSAII